MSPVSWSTWPRTNERARSTRWWWGCGRCCATTAMRPGWSIYRWRRRHRGWPGAVCRVRRVRSPAVGPAPNSRPRPRESSLPLRAMQHDLPPGDEGNAQRTQASTRVLDLRDGDPLQGDWDNVLKDAPLFGISIDRQTLVAYLEEEANVLRWMY